MPHGASLLALAIPVKVFNLHTCKAANANYRLSYDSTGDGDDCVVQLHSTTDVKQLG